MKKISLIFKEASQSRIKESLKDSNAVFVIKYSGVKSADMSSLRQVLKTTNSRLFVVKNSVAQRVMRDAGLESMLKAIEGPCGLIFVKEEPVSASKALFLFSKEHENLKLDGGLLKDKVITKNDIEAMSKLPSKDMLRAQVVGALNAPISGLVMTLNQLLVKFVICLDQIKQKKGN